MKTPIIRRVLYKDPLLTEFAGDVRRGFSELADGIAAVQQSVAALAARRSPLIFYVDGSGDLPTAQQTGSEAYPFKTIQQGCDAAAVSAIAVAMASAFSIVHVAPGNYDEHVTIDLTRRRLALVGNFTLGKFDAVFTAPTSVRNITLTGSAAYSGYGPSFLLAPELPGIGFNGYGAFTAGAMPKISGDIRQQMVTGGGIDKVVLGLSALVFGKFDATGSTVNPACILVESFGLNVRGAVVDPGRTLNFYLSRDCFFAAAVECYAFGDLAGGDAQGCGFGGNVTVSDNCTFKGCDFTAGATVAAASAKTFACDAYTAKTLEPCTLTNVTVSCGSVVETLKALTTDFVKTNDAAPAAIGTLQTAVKAGRTYRFEATLFVSAGATGGHRFGVNLSVGTLSAITYDQQLLDNATSAYTVTDRKTANGAVSTQAGTLAGVIKVQGTVTVTANGTLSPIYAQSVSDGTASKVLTGSTWRVSLAS